jgi:hypothetical protein
MKKIIIFTFLLFGATAFAQTTVTNSIFPAAGDTLLRSTTVNIGAATVTAPSATAQNWDLNFLSTDAILLDSVRYASAGMAFSNFPNTEIILPVIGFGQGYVDITATDMTMVGAGLDIMGLAIVAPFSNPQTIQQAPLTYGTPQISDTHSLLFAQHIDSLPGLRQVIDGFGLPVSPDSIRLKLDGSSNLLIDAYGTLTIADSTYDVLRQRVRILNEIKIEVFVPAFGTGFWLDVTDNIGSSLPFPLNDTTNRYDFWTEGSIVPVARFNMDSNNDFIQSIEFLGYKEPTGITNSQKLTEISVFPNPANHLIIVQAEGLSEEIFDLQIVDAMGRMIYKVQNLSSSTQTLSTAEIPQGNFWMILTTKNGKLLARKALTIAR